MDTVAELKGMWQSQFQVADWEIDPASGRIQRDGTTHKLEPRVMALLVVLAEHPGVVLSREELEARVWSGMVVGYDALSSAIIKLRKALGDDPHHPQFIETISKKGYRLIAPVQETGAVAESHSSQNGGRSEKIPRFNLQFHKPTWLVMTVVLFMLAVVLLNWQLGRLSAPEIDDIGYVLPSTDTPSIAVLPFSNLSDDPAQIYFSDGITEDLITDLSRLSGLTVIARNSVFSFKGSMPEPQEVARHLGARYLLQGSVRRVANRVRINVTFIDAESGLNIWAERFDGSLDDVFTLQDQVVNKVVKALKVELTAQELENLKKPKAANVEALQEFFWGRATYGSISKQENEAARKRYRRAIELDPNFAEAYAALSLTYLDDWRRRWGASREVAITQAFDLAQKAIQIDPSVPLAHFALGYISLYVHKGHDKAIEKAKKVLELDPNYADGYALLSSAYFFSGYPEKALPLDRKAMRLNPASSFLYLVHLGRSYYFQKHYEQALEAFLNADERNHNYISNHIWLAATYAQLNQLEDAAWEVDQILTLDPDFSLSHWMDTRPLKKNEHRQ
ncbi:MAG: tetratricopeptide repeat protein, partial [Halobacteria archaeon]|nr:tetratricopeptide repeat protein [Halobacteria archaeon]